MYPPLQLWVLHPKQLLREPQDKREGTSTLRRVWHVCDGLLVDFQSLWVLDIACGTPCARPTPKFLSAKNLNPKEIFVLEIFLEQQIFGKYCKIIKILERNIS